MSNRTQAGVLALLLVAVAGCDSTRAPGPTAPSPVQQPSPQPAPPPTPAGIQLAGIVSDAAFRQLAGARVEVVDGPQAGLSTMTDSKGEYRLTGAFDETTHFRASKDGHVAATQPFPTICERCNPPWWVNFYLEAVAPHANLAGDYTLTFIADSACTALPDEARTRTYGATVTPVSLAIAPPNSWFLVTVTGGTFVEHYNSFTIGIAGDYLVTDIGNAHGAPGLVEVVAPNTYLTFAGAVSTSVTDTSTITAALSGDVDRCELTTEWGSRYNCGDGETVARAHCGSPKHQLILARR